MTYIWYYYKSTGQPDVIIQHPSNTPIQDETVLVKESDKYMEIACSGQQPVLWSYPNTAQDKITVRTTAELNPITSELHYDSVLMLSNMSYTDTGEYACVFVSYAGTPLESEQRRAQYVYVTSTSKLQMSIIY